MNIKLINTAGILSLLTLAAQTNSAPTAIKELSNLSIPVPDNNPNYNNLITRAIPLQTNATQEDCNKYFDETFKNLLVNQESHCPSTTLRFIHHDTVYNDLLNHPDIKPKLEDGFLSRFDIKSAIENAIFINCPNTRTTEDGYKHMIAGLVIAITVFTAGVGVSFGCCSINSSRR